MPISGGVVVPAHLRNPDDSDPNPDNSPSIPASECKSADQLLALLGPSNPFLLSIWLAMSLLWGIIALPIMGSAFLMDDFCPKNGETVKNATNSSSSAAAAPRNCTPRAGTVTAQFHLDASQSLLVDLTTSAFVAGMAVGGLFMPFLADRRGRRPAVVLSLFLCGLAGCASAFSPNLWVFIGLRFAQGLSYSGCAMINWVLAYECIPLRLRSLTAFLFGLMWVLGYCLVAPLAYFTSTWRHFIMGASVPALLFSFLYFFTIPESFHFLVAEKRSAKAREWIGKANKWANRVGTRQITPNEMGKFVEHMEKKDLEHKKEESNGGTRTSLIHQLQANRTLLLYLSVFVYLWTCDTFVYYGISLFSTQLAGDRYVNFVLVALAEVPAYIVTPALIDKFGRRLFTSFTHLLAALAFLAVLISSNPRFFLALWLLGKFAISCSFTGLFVYSSEVFPTVHRNLFMGICTTLSQASGIFAPTIRIMAEIRPTAPMIFFGLCSLLAGLVTFLLPETRGKELPEKKIQEIENELN